MSSRTVVIGAVSPTPRIESVRILLTNDDGISAPGLQALRRALREFDDVSVDVIAPDSNRSATARSITTRSPLAVEEVAFDDGAIGYATDGTPVDCVRFAELGLVGGRPDLIVSGINHGANLGDDITYSGTVAAALEGIILGIPAVALSQQSSGGGMGYVSGRFDFAPRAAFAAAPGRAPAHRGDARGDPDQRQLPRRRAAGDRGDEARQTDLQRRAAAGRGVRRTGAATTRSTAGSPATRRSREPTSTRSPTRRIAVTPIHFDLTDHGGLESLRGWGFEEMLAASTATA